MASRSYFGVAIESPEQRSGYVGVIMFESLDAGRWSDAAAKVEDIAARLKLSLGYLILQDMTRQDGERSEAQEVYP